MKTDKQHIEQLVSRYFDGETTLAEERRLRRLLAECDACSESIREARAVMGVAEVMPVPSVEGRHTWRPTASIAAAVAVIFAIATAVFFTPRATDDEVMIAYVNGERVTDSDLILQTMNGQLEPVADAQLTVSGDVDEQLDALREVLFD